MKKISLIDDDVLEGIIFLSGFLLERWVVVLGGKFLVAGLFGVEVFLFGRLSLFFEHLGVLR